MQAKHHWSFFIIIFAASLAVSCSQKTSVQESASTVKQVSDPKEIKRLKERLNSLLYWQIADELDLDTVTEKKMEAILESIQVKRERALLQKKKAFEDMEESCMKGAEKVNESKTISSLDRHVASFRDLAAADNEEYEKLLELLGEVKLAKFYVIRSRMSHKLKSLVKPH